MFNSRDDFNKIYAFSFDLSYCLAFCETVSHNIATKVVYEAYDKLFDDNLNFESQKQAINQVLRLTNHFVFNYLAHKKKKYLYTTSAIVNLDEEQSINDGKNFLVNIVNRALTSKEMKEVYVMKFFLHLSIDEIADILKVNSKAVETNLCRARMLVLNEYEKSVF